MVVRGCEKFGEGTVRQCSESKGKAAICKASPGNGKVETCIASIRKAMAEHGQV